jgi:RHH-type rel operon transcriptional repressor/antitoxin RelB
MDSVDRMATTVRLKPATEQRLDQLAQLTGRTRAFTLRQLIEAGLDDLEDAYLGAAVAERIRLGQERTYSLDDVVSELGLEPLCIADPSDRSLQPF